jgi:hypothetical protein
MTVKTEPQTTPRVFREDKPRAPLRIVARARRHRRPLPEDRDQSSILAHCVSFRFAGVFVRVSLAGT